MTSAKVSAGPGDGGCRRAAAAAAAGAAVPVSMRSAGGLRGRHPDPGGFPALAVAAGVIVAGAVAQATARARPAASASAAHVMGNGEGGEGPSAYLDGDDDRRRPTAAAPQGIRCRSVSARNGMASVHGAAGREGGTSSPRSECGSAAVIVTST